MAENETAKQVLKRHDFMQGSRVNWDEHWQEIAEYIIPKKDDIYGAQTAGEKKHNRLYTSTSIHANEMLASALHGMLTNPSTTWFGLSTGDEALDKDKDVKEWLQKVTNIMIDTMNFSNFQTEVHEVYLDLGSFGTSIFRVEEDDELMVRYEARPVYEAYIDEDYRGMVDTVSYEYCMKLREIAQEFGTDAFSDKLNKMLMEDEDQKFTVIHMVKPRQDFSPNLKTPENKPFGSWHVIKEEAVLLKESGFDSNPYIVPRWSKISGEVYGRSPGMKALSDIKMVNSMQKSIIRGAQKTVDPPLMSPDDGVILPINTKPGGINYYRAGTKDRIEPMNTGARPDLGEEIVGLVEQKIKEAFFIDQLQVRMADRMTATEVMQRREEQLRMLGPILGRMHFEFLRPLVNRTYSIMLKNDAFPEAPSEIAGKELQVQYTSQIAQAQRTSETDNLSRVLGIIGPMAEMKPEMIQMLDGEAIVRDLSDKFGLPAKYLLSDEQLQAIKQARAQAQQRESEKQDMDDTIETVSKLDQLGGQGGTG